MKKIVFLLFAIFLFAKDSDLDGVPDELDKCPNTPFLALVDKNGCEIKFIKKYSLIYFGYEKDYINSKVYLSRFIGFSTYFNKLLISWYFSEYNTNKGYKVNVKNFGFGYKNSNIKIKIKLYTPTYTNDKYYFSYFFKSYNYFNISFEHKNKNLKYNNSLKIEKIFKINNFTITPYSYIYLTNSTTFIGSYISYPFSDFSISLNISTATNNSKDDFYISTALSYNF